MPEKTIKNRVLECLSEGPKTSAEVVDATGITKRQAIDTISMLRKKGLLRGKRKVGQTKVWAFTEKGEQELRYAKPIEKEIEMEEEGLTWYDKVSDAIGDSIEDAREKVDELLDKISEEKSFEIKLEDFGLKIGDRKYGGTGSIKINISALK